MGVRELAKQGQHTANEVIKKATQTVYEANFKKFASLTAIRILARSAIVV
ncbi:hypothetical protein PF005_g32993 [Phytophthora fragariae]|uniref:Uncharacterized protein n=1 Tax=Phytophthora fragariae TaxID=53985 RepID=A0A6A4AMZ7_9STRA|nr:hypothetical protein PF003_g16837 [Phytophthora fragariae]KAE8902392.1 hypothetical protein PF003_g13238 [Phytophthora fragariae]KAE8916782.1 hypothetical protein PF009_g32895 [Phytophthora fragariae]KAE9055199.1 hypothetical protein PF010_g32238 [Phytophthora fragariae]KAE9065592.1 hypothetical protein PF006_g30430 [Phytophthora fragariae]